MPINRLLVAATIVCGVPGLVLLFAAEEVLLRLGGAPATPAAAWLVGVLGGTLVAIALMNWFQRHSMVGGIYGRPLLLANTLVLTNAFFSTLRMWRSSHQVGYAVVAACIGALLAAFARRYFVDPSALRPGANSAAGS